MITAVPVDFPDSALEAEVLDDLARVEAWLSQTAHPDHELLTEADLTEEALRTEALALLRVHPALAEARAHVLSWAQGARNEIMTLPDVPARAAFLALCDFVEKRTG